MQMHRRAQVEVMLFLLHPKQRSPENIRTIHFSDSKNDNLKHKNASS